MMQKEKYKKNMSKYTNAFRPLDLSDFKKENRHDIDWRNVLKQMSNEIYGKETNKNPKTDGRLAHDPLPSMRI